MTPCEALFGVSRNNKISLVAKSIRDLVNLVMGKYKKSGQVVINLPAFHFQKGDL